MLHWLDVVAANLRNCLQHFTSLHRCDIVSGKQHLGAAFPSAHRVSECKECGVLALLLPQRQVALQVLQGGHVDVSFARSQLGNVRVLSHQAISRH